MATGYINTPLASFDRGGAGSYELAPLPQNERGLGHEWDRDDGVWFFRNSDPIPQNYGAHRQFSFLDDFYFRIYLLPNVLDFGAIVTTTTRNVTVWNAYFEPATLESIDLFFGTEVIQGGPALPNTIPALTLRAWNFTVGTVGPPNLEDTATFTFDTGEVFDVEITGQRSLLWPFLPNWREPFRVTREFATDIFTSRAGREQRSARRFTSRKSYEFLVTTKDDDLRRYREIMAFWQHRPFVVADCSRSVLSTSDMDAGETTMQLDAIPTWAVEDVALVLSFEDQISLRVVDNVDSDGLLTFKDTDTFNWPAGTTVYAGVVAKLSTGPRARRFHNGVQEANVQFLQLPGTEQEVVTQNFALFNGKEIFLGQPNWGSSVTADDEHDTDTLDMGHGRIITTSAVPFSRQIWAGDYVGKTSVEIEELMHMFERMRGRQGEFYMPTWENDLPVKLPLTAGTQGLRVEGLSTLDAFADDPTTRAVMVQFTDGTRLFRTVEEIVEIEDDQGHDTVVQMEELWPETYAVDDIDFACWVKCWRFASDALTAEFFTDSVANLRMNLQTLEDLPAEDEESNS